MDAKTVFIALLRSEVCGQPVTEEVKSAISPEMLEKIHICAKRQDLGHLVGSTLGKLGLLGEDDCSKELKQLAMTAVYRYVLLMGTLKKLCDILSQAQIPHIPLKGSVLRPLYPEPWQRTSCDIDILVKPEDLDRASQLLREQHHYTYHGKSSHDISLFSPEGVHLELHYDTIDEGWASESRKVMARIWDYARPIEEGSYRYELTNELFWFYHIAHMARHFENGGCGIRPFIDLWVMGNKMTCDRAAYNALLEEGKLTKFAEAAEYLSKVWFSGAAETDMSRRMEAYLIDAGAYGSWENRVVIRRGKIGGVVGSKLRYLGFRIFLPHNYLKARYPILKKHKWLTPVYTVVRWVEVFTKRSTKKVAVEFKTNIAISNEESDATAKFLKELGL